MSFILNYSGMGTGKYTSPQELLTLPKDKRGEDIVAPVNSDFKAYEILDTFKQL